MSSLDDNFRVTSAVSLCLFVYEFFVLVFIAKRSNSGDGDVGSGLFVRGWCHRRSCCRYRLLVVLVSISVQNFSFLIIWTIVTWAKLTDRAFACVRQVFITVTVSQITDKKVTLVSFIIRYPFYGSSGPLTSNTNRTVITIKLGVAYIHTYIRQRAR